MTGFATLLVRMFVQTMAFIFVLGAILMGAAGTLAWPSGWTFLALFAALNLALGAWLAVADPDLLLERMRPVVRREQKPWDRMLMACAGLGFLAWLAFMAADARRFGWSQAPTSVQVLGAGLICLCYGGVAAIFQANTYASPVVKVQAGHKVVDSGPYAWIRHPMYAGVQLFFAGAALMLGSWWGLIVVPLSLPVLAARAVGEERALTAELPGYAQYARRVRWRFAPGVW